ncbi:hypothetical protein [Marinobacter sp. C2H3]|uniref:hypothetical protein n=1 Tax=Marinobacter sp. C2H3 TaxID=3119003 RepID=UPI00300E7ADC
MTEKKTYHLHELLAQCDPNAPMPESVREWDQAVAVGLEQTMIGDQLDTWNDVPGVSQKTE